MPCRSRLIASTRSSRSAVSVLCWVSISPSSSSARRLTAPSRSRSRRSRSRSCSMVATSGSSAFGSMPASAATPSGSTSSISWISWATSVSLRLAPSTRSSARAASSRAEPSASSAARTARSQAASAFSASARRSAASRRAASAASTSVISALRFSSKAAGASASDARSWLGFGAAGVERGDLGDRAVAALAPGLTVGPDGDEPPVGELGLARQRLRLGAHFGQFRALAFDLGADGGELAAPVRRTAAVPRGLLRPRPTRRLRLVAAADQPRLGLGQRRDARGVARHLALGHGLQLAGVVGLALGCAPVLRGRRLRRRRLRSGRPAPLRRPCACRRPRCAR